MEYSFIASTFVLCLIAFYFGRVASKWQDFEFIEDFKKRGQIALLKPIYIFVALFVGAHILILFFSLLGEILAIPTNKNVVDVRDLALAFIGSITAIGALFGVYLAILRSEENKRQNEIANDQSKTANRQAKTAEQGLITDRINKAVEGLGKINQAGDPVLEVRIGALYALERIAQDSLRDHIRIMKIICAYIRVRNLLGDSSAEAHPVGEDVRAALIIIGLRGKWSEGQEHLKEEINKNYWFDFRNCNLNNADLNHANLNRANLTNATLENAHLSNATLNYTRLNSTNLTKAGINNTDFKNTFTWRSFAYECDFSNCLNLTQEQLDLMYCGFDVIINKENEPKKFDRPDHWPKTKLSENDFIEKYKEWLETQE